MEELLKQFMEQMNKRFDEFAIEQNEMRKEIGAIKSEQDKMRKEMNTFKNAQEGMQNEIASLAETMKSGFNSVAEEQSEMRKEVAFYYGSLMREIDNSRVEARSQFKYLEAVVDRHRGAIELLGERTKAASKKDNE